MSVQAHPGVSVEELRRAWRAVQDGQFRGCGTAGPEPRTRGWTPTGPVLPVVGCAGSVGSTVIALALATAAGSARVVECCPSRASGLAAASTAELGCRDTGWSHGRRDRVLLERVADDVAGPELNPVPDEAGPDVALTVLDIGWDLTQVLAGRSWLARHLRQAPVAVAVTTATVPGLRRLEHTLSMLAPPRVLVAVVGPARRRWPRGLDRSLGPLAHALTERGDLVDAPRDPTLAVRGPDTAPLPAGLIAAAARLLALADLTPTNPKETGR